jgi:heptosyltransferase-1
MKVLIVKTSSMGDVIHTLPAVTDACKALTSISFDWVVEENFAEIPKWHSHVDRVIPVALRRWRKNLFAASTRAEWREFRKQLRTTNYDLIIDAQGLVKSAFLARNAQGVRCGLDWQSAREPLASLLYQRKYFVEKKQHAIERVRSLFSQALGYELPTSVPEYGIDRRQFLASTDSPAYLVFLHGTTWPTKHWPEEYWLQLARIATQKGFVVKLPWGNPAEKERAQRIASSCDNVEVLDRLNLVGIARVLAGAKAIVAVDTGLCHLAAALDVPTVSLYGPTNPVLTGALGQSQKHLSANFPCAPCLSRECTFQAKTSDNQPSLYASPLYPPCFETLPPPLVWASLEMLL